MTTPTHIAFAALQASARNFAGLDNARALIFQVRNIRRQQYAQLLEDAEREQCADEPRQMVVVNDELEPSTMLCAELQQAA